jgi:hypothetical protein
MRHARARPAHPSENALRAMDCRIKSGNDSKVVPRSSNRAVNENDKDSILTARCQTGSAPFFLTPAEIAAGVAFKASTTHTP